MNSLPASTSEIYELLVSLLSKRPQTIEILPGDGSIWASTQNPNDIESFSPFLFVQGNLGISQKILYRVYLHAVRIFKSARSCISRRLATATQPNHNTLDPSLILDLTASSSILLLANPAHQTALNIRKRLVRLRIIDPDAELRFTSLLLSSQQCAKQGELWYHRRWILCSVYDPKLPGTATTGADPCCRLRFASPEALRDELELVSQACELYPRNYFAWTHRLLCMRSLLSDYLVGIDIVGLVPVLRNEIAAVKRWIDCHVSDYSAIHTVVMLSQAALKSGDPLLIEIVVEQNLLGHAISLVKEYPIHEALWMYIRMALSISGPWQLEQMQQFTNDFVQPLAHLQCSKIDIKDNLVKASQYAMQFLNKRVGHNFIQDSNTKNPI